MLVFFRWSNFQSFDFRWLDFPMTEFPDFPNPVSFGLFPISVIRVHPW
jgi:hypothetical protein